MPRTAAPKKAARTGKPAAERPPLPADAVLLAMDASSTAIGYAVFCAGRLTLAGLAPAAPKGWRSHRRILHNANAMLDIIGRLDDEPGCRPTVVCMEWNSHLVSANNRRATGLATLGQAQGYLLGLLHERHPDLDVELIGEREWTRWPGRCMNVKKELRARRIIEEVPEYRDAIEAGGKDDGLDVADSIGIGLWRLGRIA